MYIIHNKTPTIKNTADGKARSLLPATNVVSTNVLKSISIIDGICKVCKERF